MSALVHRAWACREPKISVVVPHMDSIPGAPEALDQCIASLVGHDELIIVMNEGIGFGAACNQGLRRAHGDFIVIANNDTVMTHGSLRDLMDFNAITKPMIIGQPDQKPRCFYCMPRWVYEDVGGYDERFKIGYFEDDDMIRRWDEAGILYRTIYEVEVFHKDGGGMTIKKLGQDGKLSSSGEQENMEANRSRYEEKWNPEKKAKS